MSRTQPDEPIQATRIRDMPAPRLAEGVAARPMRWAFTWPYRVILLGVYRAGFRPWHLMPLGSSRTSGSELPSCAASSCSPGCC